MQRNQMKGTATLGLLAEVGGQDLTQLSVDGGGFYNSLLMPLPADAIDVSMVQPKS